VELLRRGQKGSLTGDSAEIDQSIVNMEQTVAQRRLDALAPADRQEIVGDLDEQLRALTESVDGRMFVAISPLGSGQKAPAMAAQVLGRPLQYAKFSDRVLIGTIATQLHRRKDLILAVAKGPTGFMVKKGERISFVAYGKVDLGRSWVVSPAGMERPSTSFWAPPSTSSPYGGLVGVWRTEQPGMDPQSPQPPAIGPIFNLGERGTVVAPRDCYFQLFVNDSFRIDNTGFFVVSIRRT